MHKSQINIAITQVSILHQYSTAKISAKGRLIFSPAIRVVFRMLVGYSKPLK